jgi:hypothetical protein
MTLTLAPRFAHVFTTGPIHHWMLSDNRTSGNTLLQPTTAESRWPSTIAVALRPVQSLSDLLKAGGLSVTVEATTY